MQYTTQIFVRFVQLSRLLSGEVNKSNSESNQSVNPLVKPDSSSYSPLTNSSNLNGTSDYRVAMQYSMQSEHWDLVKLDRQPPLYHKSSILKTKSTIIFMETIHTQCICDLLMQICDPARLNIAGK